MDVGREGVVKGRGRRRRGVRRMFVVVMSCVKSAGDLLHML